TNNLSISILVINSKASKETHSFYHEACENAWIINHPNILVRYLKLLLLIPLINLKGFITFYSNGQGNNIYIIKKLLFNVKNWVHHHHTSGDENDQKTWTKPYLKTLQNATVVIACAQYNAEQMNKVLNRKVISIPCFSRIIKITRKPIDTYKVKIGYIGRLIKEKGIESLCGLSNNSELKNIAFYIWGEGKMYDENYFKNYPNLKYMGSFKNKEELTIALNTIDAFILHSTHPEGLPISLLEVMSAGLPWIATDRGGIKELKVDEHFNYLLPQETNEMDLIMNLKNFTDSLINKEFNYQKQIDAYHKKYAPEVLIDKWKLVLEGN
ncbi:MAG: glycosyltransferase family 4 protein, partial [Bacteroidia bacterium]|nr:glycosyltransferase family 4 protein [Bacteroidia bacterium]